MTRIFVLILLSLAACSAPSIGRAVEKSQVYAAPEAVHSLTTGRLLPSDLPLGFVDAGVHQFSRYTAIMTATVARRLHRCAVPSTISGNQWKQGMVQVLYKSGATSYVSLCSWQVSTSAGAVAAFNAAAAPVRTLAIKQKEPSIPASGVGDQRGAWNLSRILGGGSYAVVFRRSNAVVTLSILDTPEVSAGRAVALARMIDRRLR